MSTEPTIRILLLEDNPVDAELTEYALQEAQLSFNLLRVETEADFERELIEHPPDLILSDFSLPQFDGFRALSIAQARHPTIPFIFVTGTLGEEVAIETLKGGATDYVLKTRLNRLVGSVQRAMREATERAERLKAQAQLQESHEQLRALSVYLQTVREEERTRIAREVHDELGQALTGLKLDLSWLAQRIPKEQDGLVEKARGMVKHIDSTIQTVRRISTELRPGILDDLGLGAALEWQATEFQNRTEIICDVNNELRDTMLDVDLNTTFFRIFQETLTNVMRHAEATQVDVRFYEKGDRVVLEVQDNGRGVAASDLKHTRSIGVLGMKERAGLLGGEFHILGKPGQGTRVVVSVPVHRESDMLTTQKENPHRSRFREAASASNSPSRP